MDRFELLRTELTRRCPGLELREEEPMARHTSFRIGGPARLMALPRTEEEARERTVAVRFETSAVSVHLPFLLFKSDGR